MQKRGFPVQTAIYAPSRHPRPIIFLRLLPLPPRLLAATLLRSDRVLVSLLRPVCGPCLPPRHLVVPPVHRLPYLYTALWATPESQGHIPGIALRPNPLRPRRAGLKGSGSRLTQTSALPGLGLSCISLPVHSSPSTGTLIRMAPQPLNNAAIPVACSNIL